MVTDTLLDDLLPGANALRILVTLYRHYGRPPFPIRLQDLEAWRWSGRSEQQRFQLAIALLVQKHYLKLLEGSRYEIATQDLIDAEELHGS